MNLWFSEDYTLNVKLSIKVDEHLYSGTSEFQKIDIFNSVEFGKILVIDGYLMLTEKDEFIYHEMIVHTPMAVQKRAENILVIGAGDGGVARELCKYSTIRNIDIVEIDKQVVEVCKEFLPQTACGFNDCRVNLFYQDGVKFVEKCKGLYDIIIVDSTDPFGPGEGLFTQEFYANCNKALKYDGIMINQHESPFYENDATYMKRAHNRIYQSFPISKVYQAHIPTYASGHWLFGFASKKLDPIADICEESWNSLNIKTKYYNTNLHKGSFALPNYVIQMLNDAEK